MGEKLQSSALGFVFQMSRVLGVAPVTFTSTNMHLCRRLHICSIVFFTAINCMSIAGLIFDFKAEPRRSIRVESGSSALVWFVNLVNISLISAVGVYCAPYRIQCVKKVLAAVTKMKTKIRHHKLNNIKVECDKKLLFTCMFLCVSVIGLVLGDIYKYAENTIEDDKEVKVLLLYTGFYFEILCSTLFECQFIVIAFEVQNVLVMISSGLENLLRNVNQPKRKNQLSIKRNYFTQTKGNVICINNFIDNKPAGVLLENLEGQEIIIHDYATAYGDACDLMREVDSGFGLQLLLILMSFFLELIVTPYYLMTALYTMDRDVSYLVLQVLWVLYHLISMGCVVEPAYLTQLEIEKTENLISRYFRHVKSYEPVYAELEVFSRQLILNRPTYSPMGVCTLSRQLCVSVLGAVTTYLVIIIQFRENEK